MSTINSSPSRYGPVPKDPKHRRQVIWQILVPLALVAVIFVAVIVLAAVGTARSADTGTIWAGISAVWLIIPILFGGLIVLAIVIGLVYLMNKAIGVTPYYSLILRTYFYKAASAVINLLNKLAAPVISVRSYQASARTLGEFLRFRRRS
jgi:hypothetical protein